MTTPNATILAVDDDPITLRLITSLLRQENYTVIAARDGAEAVHILRKIDDIHLILSDIDMPGINGFELLRIVRQNEAWSQIPFLFLSIREAWLDMQYAKILGGNSYLTKPINRDLLLGHVAGCLGGCAWSKFSLP